MTKPAQRIHVRKTYKLYIGGKFPRSESGRSLPVKAPRGKDIVAYISHASRKDLRDAVAAAQKAQAGWHKMTAYLRGQILYRVAEMVETRKSAFVDELQRTTTQTVAQARNEVEAAIDRLVWYAGWADKYVQCFGSVNPVAAPFFNFTLPEPIGVVGVIAPDECPLLGLVSKIAPAIISGNAVVVVASETAPLTAITFAEVLATSDVPAGVVNILTGLRKELLPVMAGHMGVHAIDYSGTHADEIARMQQEAPANVKRIIVRETPKGRQWFDAALGQSPYWITKLCEMKTAWHPIGL